MTKEQKNERLKTEISCYSFLEALALAGSSLSLFKKAEKALRGESPSSFWKEEMENLTCYVEVFNEGDK